MPLRSLITVAVRFLGVSGTSGRRNRSRLFGAVVGVGLSTVPLVVVQQISDSMIRGIVTRFVELGSYHARAVARVDTDVDQIAAVVEGIRAVPGVDRANHERQGFGLIYSEDGRTGVTLRAVPSDFWSDPAVIGLMSVEAGALAFSGSQSVLLGVDVAERLRVGPGDSVRVLTVRPTGTERVFTRVTPFVVEGVVSTGYRDLDRLWVFVPLDRGLRMIPDESARDIVGVKLADPFALPNPIFDRGAARIDLDGRRGQMIRTFRAIASIVPGSWVVSDWYSAERGRYRSFLTSRNLLAFVMAMILVVAATNIASTLVVLVVEREDEIAILRACGVSGRALASCFLFAGAVIGTLGAVVGIAFGLWLAIHINVVLGSVERAINWTLGRSVELLSADFYLEEIPTDVTLVPVVLACCLAIGLSVVAAVIPARKAARVPPEQALRRRK